MHHRAEMSVGREVMNILEHALKHAAKGLLVFPCHSIVDGKCTCKKSDCKKPGKHPAIAKWSEAATTDPEAIRKWDWVNRNIGATFPDDVFVLDTDVKGNGPLNLAWLEHIHGTLPRTLTIETGSGGQHRYFRSKDKIPQSVGLIHCGIDTRVSGKGYVIVPPSIHASGRRYRVEIDAPIAEASEWLVRLANLTKKATAEPDWSTMTDGSGRNEAIHKWLSSMRARGASDQEIRSLAESRNGLMAEPLPDDELENTVLRSVLGYEKGKDRKKKFRTADPEVVMENLLPMIATNELTNRIMIEVSEKTTPGAGTPEEYRVSGRTYKMENLTDTRVKLLRYDLSVNHNLLPTYNALDEAITQIAHKNRFHPIRQYLNQFKWDGKERLDTWVIRYLGVDDLDLYRAYGRCFMIAAVRRIRKPGTKFDHMLILEGSQGIGKSSAARVLAIKDHWFTDSADPFENDKKLIESVSGKWIVEESELHVLRRTEVERVKTILSRQSTNARLSYDRQATEHPHQFVMIGTTNEESYLKDLTGNRRFWSMKCTDIQLESLKQDVHQLWAEAAWREAQGESHFLPETLWNAQRESSEERLETHQWEEVLPPILVSVEGRISRSTLATALGVPFDRWNGRHDQVLKRVMEKEGWEKKRIHVPGSGGRRGYFYVKGNWADREILPQDLPYERLS